MRIATDDERALRIASNVVELVLSELPGHPAPHTELAAVARKLGSARPGGRGAPTSPTPTPATPTW